MRLAKSNGIYLIVLVRHCKTTFFSQSIQKDNQDIDKQKYIFIYVYLFISYLSKIFLLPCVQITQIYSNNQNNWHRRDKYSNEPHSGARPTIIWC